MWHGYFLLEVSDSLTPAQLVKVRDAVLEMGRQTDDQPARITHIRQRLDKRAIIGEITLQTKKITKAQVVTKLANKLGVSEQAVIDNVEQFVVFPGANWEKRRETAVQYIVDNDAEWEEAVP